MLNPVAVSAYGGATLFLAAVIVLLLSPGSKLRVSATHYKPIVMPKIQLPAGLCVSVLTDRI